MRKFVVLAFLFFVHATCLISQQVWVSQNPKPTGNNIYSVTFKSQNSVFVVGSVAMILRSDDGGSTWFPQMSGADPNYALNDIRFLGTNKGVMAGNSAIYYTNNGGLNWTNVQSASQCKRIFVYDSLNLFVISNSEIFKSSNGGSYWVTLSLTLSGYSTLNGLSFTNSNTGIAVGYTSIYGSGWPPNFLYDRSLIAKTTNGGNTWNIDSIGNGFRCTDIVKLSDSKTIISCNDFHLFKTSNNGTNWTYDTIPLTGSKRIKALDSNKVFIICDNAWNETTNGGQSWYIKSAPAGGPLTDISFNNSGTGIVVGETGCIGRTTNGGSNYFALRSGFIANYDWDQVIDINFVDMNVGFALLNWGGVCKIYKTTNVGQNWTLLYSFGGGVYGMYFINSNVGFVVGNSGMTYKTSNGGANWVYSGFGFAVLNDVRFINDTTGFICGEGGTLYKTSDMGSTWLNINTGSSADLLRIRFYNSRIGAIVGPGTGGTILWTTDGGVSWDVKSSGLSSYTSFNGICLTDSNTAIIADRDYRLLKTTNSGANWRVVTSFSSSYSFNDVNFLNKSVGVAIGNNGIIFKSTDGGENWSQQQSNSFRNLLGCSVRGNNNFTVFGEYLEILASFDANAIGMQQIGLVIPQQYKLTQNYPNPFNPTTKIKFDVPKSSFTKIVIYDLLGRVVTTLLNEELKPGTYSVDWDGGNYASGIYFYRLEVRQAGSTTDEFVETKKMVLMK